MKKILIPTTIVIASLALLAATDKLAWSDQEAPAYNTPPPVRSAPDTRNELQSDLAENEQRLNGVYRELQGAQELLQQAGKALYRAQAGYQESSRIQRMLHDRMVVTSASGYRDKQIQGKQAANEWEIERYRAFAQNLENQRSKLQQAVEGRDQQIAILKQALQEARAASQGSASLQEKHDQQLSALSEELGEANRQLAESTQQLEESRSAARQVRIEQNVRDQQLATLQQKLEQARYASEQFQSEKINHEQQLSQLQAELMDARASMNKAQQDVLASQQDLLKTNILLKEARTGQISLVQELETVKAANTNSKKFLRDTLAVRNQLKDRLSACNASLTRVRANFATLQPIKVDRTSTDTAVVGEIEPAIEPAAETPSGDNVSRLDSDGDGLIDKRDLCAQTPDGKEVGGSGCELNAPISLQGVNFRYDSSELTPESRVLLDQVAGILQQQPDLTHEVAGHTDTQGTAAYNLWLSQQRADSVKSYLVGHGVQPDQLIAVGYGGTRPIADNKTWEGLVSNRRVELNWVE